MIYVDSAFIEYGRMKMSHMVSDTSDEELHQMAEMIGIRREYFQGSYQDKKIPHYDVCKSKRLLAIKNGAKEVTTRELIRIKREQNEKRTE